MFAKIHLWVRRFLHVSVGRPQCFFLGKGDVDVCAFFFILILILPSCSSLKFFSFNFSAATHILIGTLCLRRDSGIGVSTQFNSFCCGFGVCCVSFVAGGDGRNVCKRWQQSLFSSFPSFFLFFSYSFFFFFPCNPQRRAFTTVLFSSSGFSAWARIVALLAELLKSIS